ncbi:peroxisome biogenesis protein 19-2-like [Phalaenopsis equestris]|uniref:peroxisome biogenesis protein 19-2-like n=1 Tax=Phalaenopsis equestris TaxID=78828 RepID=UPI0009E62AC3|nr:peroxisome biogenesis protein 19-2-like [Phalaenopsis equestris]
MSEPYPDDLDQLLDSALDDFAKLDLAPSQRGSSSGGEGKEGRGDVLAQASSSSSVRGLGIGLPDLRSRKQQRALPPKKTHATETLEKLTQQTREAVRELESVTSAAAAGSRAAGGFDEESMVEDFVKQFEELAGSQDMESIVETMMQQLLSKEILQEPMKEIGERYPKWLQEHKSSLSKEEYDRYYRQYELILKLNEAYEEDPDNFHKIVDLMQKMQECGQPPSDIVEELAPGLDLNNLTQLPRELLESPPSNCCIM